MKIVKYFKEIFKKFYLWNHVATKQQKSCKITFEYVKWVKLKFVKFYSDVILG